MRPGDLADMARAMGRSRRAAVLERRPRAELERHQHERLASLMAYAAQHSPFWRERLGAGPVRLEALPVLDKATLMERFDDAVTDRRLRRDELLAHLDGLDHDALYLDHYRVMTTSGSSGTKCLFVYGREDWVEILSQFFRYSAWAGIGPRLPRRKIAAIGGAGPTHMTRRIASSIDVGLHRVLSLPVTMPLDQLVEQLNAFQPDWLNVFPSVAAPLAAEQQAGRLRLRLEGMSTSSELRLPTLTDRLHAAFGVRPMDLYAMTEGLWGTECEHRAGAHLFEDRVIVENVDDRGQAVPPGEPGARLLVTNLFNRTQPLIRFEVGDRITLDPDPCRCGRTLARVRAIDGRSDDVLRLGGAVVVPMHFAVITADPDVRQFQIVQQGDGVRVLVVLEPAADAEAARVRLAQRVAASLAQAGVANPEVTVEACSRLELGAGGKLKLVVGA